MSKDTDNLLVVFSLCLIFGLAVNMVVYHKGHKDGAKEQEATLREKYIFIEHRDTKYITPLEKPLK